VGIGGASTPAALARLLVPPEPARSPPIPAVGVIPHAVLLQYDVVSSTGLVTEAFVVVVEVVLRHDGAQSANLALERSHNAEVGQNENHEREELDEQ
jgi:hypothetical protein